MTTDLDSFTGFRPRSLPGWSPFMCRPLCFDRELAAQEAGASFPPELEPIAVFFSDSTCTQLAGDWAFIAVNADGEVFLVDDEEARSVGLRLDGFLASLEPPVAMSD
ncbi:hypothetical protein [Vitiosangium sp. GDMCC 1.1324]|uniref:hypothetical protein n=1 Tax=Vitiosangium sp. (strain GDMCC 1.1324) TaxID=2138576 RepID=UPI000D3BA865|nr:hypothetical protein [Vitiosangium sp. GDMCC 1.1324]PTL77751.1 hypothetical protein DAT35_41825 [Vitiosangium sp. GDMCC 1.1324]